MELPALDNTAPGWIEQEVEVQNLSGVHARPAMMIAKTAGAYKSEVAIRRNNAEVNAKSTIQVLTLVAERGARLTVRARGEDAQAALGAIVGLVQRGFKDG